MQTQWVVTPGKQTSG